MSDINTKLIPVTVFTGFLGSGKTTIIRHLIEQMPEKYNMAMLKNEFGDVAIDSQLAKESNIKVTEMLNGCLCCVLVGKMDTALNEIIDKYHPERIIIETSGSAYPAPIAWEIRKMKDKLKLDSIITVIDALNFSGYEDKSYTAKLQAEYTDIILINKHELVSERALEDVLDDVYELNPSTPKIKTDHGKVDPDLIFGIDTKLFTNTKDINITDHNHDHQEKEVDVININNTKVYERSFVENFLDSLPKKDFYRIKGMINIKGQYKLLNYVFGRYTWDDLKKYKGENQLLFLGKNFKIHEEKIKNAFS